jgi:hypothetical protein
MKDKPMYPFRRGNKKRGKGGGGGLPRRNRDGGGGFRRVPNSASELLPLLQPTTKALAQVLAGHAKSSGQLVHARNMLSQAERLIEERQVERMIPAHREEFFEQVARLKLTLADAEADLAAEEEEAAVEAAKPRVDVPIEKLRALALSLATPVANGPPRGAAGPEPEEEPPVEELVEERPPPRVVAPRTDIPEGSPRSARLRLKTEPKPESRGA